MENVSEKDGGYSALRHLAWSLWGNHNPEECYFAIMSDYTAYFDVSGKPHDPDVYIVAGFVSSERRWLRFEHEWRAFLGRWNIPEPFHTTEYVAAAYNGAYHQFRGDETRRIEFEREAITIVRRGMRKPISVSVFLDEYRSVMADYWIPEAATHFMRPFSMCALEALVALENWRGKKVKPHERLEYFYEDGDDDKEYFRKEHKRIVGVEPIFRPKERHIQFQACDLLAWVQARALKNHKRGVLDDRMFFSDILLQWPLYSCPIIEGEKLREKFEEWGFERVAPHIRDLDATPRLS